MSLRLTFAHAPNGNATAAMSLDGADPVAFDYVTLVKWLFDNQDAAIEVNVAESYTDDQKNVLKSCFRRLRKQQRAVMLSQPLRQTTVKISHSRDL